MKKIILLLITIFCMSYLAACGGASNDAANADGNKEIVSNSDDEPVVIEAPEVEPGVTPAPTEEPTTEPTSVPTEKPTPTPAPTENPYTGIDMESDLNGIAWIKTFQGVIDEPKVIIFNDETGRKEIIEPGDTVLINHEADILAVHLPEGYLVAGSGGLVEENRSAAEGFEIFDIDVEEMLKEKSWRVSILIEHEGEEIMIKFKISVFPKRLLNFSDLFSPYFVFVFIYSPVSPIRHTAPRIHSILLHYCPFSSFGGL